MKYNYLHIINGEIESMVERHPLENFSDKTKFIDLLKKDLNIDVVDDISDKKKNLFRVYYKDLYYNIFVEMTDGGGKDISYNKTIKKVAIPYHTKAFNKIIENYERVLVINIYVPLDQNKQPDYSKRVYLIVDPNEIYSSNVVKERTKNSSSR
ncbi:hypothetical protein JIY74_25370 [Vibrio harveyi]|nr:hypothetical protein [Vibrio harveyi]